LSGIDGEFVRVVSKNACYSRLKKGAKKKKEKKKKEKKKKEV